MSEKQQQSGDLECGRSIAKSDVSQFSDWECELFGMGQYGLRVTPKIGNVPNFFWRWMQFLMFGNRWKRRVPPI